MVLNQQAPPMNIDLESVIRIVQQRKSDYIKRIKKRKRMAEQRNNNKAVGFARMEKRRKRKEAKESTATAAGVDEFIAFEILARLPSLTLARLKSVCKSWHALISDPSFKARAMERPSPDLIIVTLADDVMGGAIDMYTYEEGCERRVARFLFRNKLDGFYDYLYPPQHSNGLLLLAAYEGPVVCNPNTNQFVILPEGSRDALSRRCGRPTYKAGFGFVPSINAYKACQYFYRQLYPFSARTRIGFEVFTIGVDSFWRVTDEDPPLPIAKSPPTSVGETVYYKVANSLHQSEPKAFLSFNLRDETFRVVEPPSSCLIDFQNMNIVSLEGKPCFVYRSQDRTKFDLWISEDCSNHAWIPFGTVNLLRPAKYVLPVAIRQGKTLLMINDGSCKLEYYNPCSHFLEPVADVAKDLAFYNAENCRLHFFDQKWPFQVLSYVKNSVPIMPGRLG